MNDLHDETAAPHLSIVIPAYNEERRIPDSLTEIADYLRKQSYTYEVVVSNDGSTDATLAVVTHFAASHPWLRLLNHPDNRGKGFAVRSGVLEAAGDHILVCDADLATPIDELDALWDRLAEGADIVIASRSLKESQLVRRQPIYREAAGRMFNLLVQAIAVAGIHDTQCGFKLFRREAAGCIFPLCLRNGFDSDIEVLYLARRLGYRILEAPVRWYHRPGSKVNLLTDGARMLVGLLKIRMLHARVKEVTGDEGC